MFKKNQGVVGFPFGLINATTGAAVTTGTVTGYVTKDGGTQATIAGTVTHEGNGQWTVDLTAGEMNGDMVGLLFTHASAIPVHFTIRTATKLVSDLVDAAAAPSAAANATAVWAEATRTITGPVTLAAATHTGAVIPTVTTTGTATNVTTVNGLAAGVIMAASIAADALTAAKFAADVTAELQAGLATASALTTLSGKVDTIDDFLDTEIAAIKAKTDGLPADPADASDIAAAFTGVNTKLDTIDDFLDTEVGAIKAKTDQLTFTTPSVVDAAATVSLGATAPAGWINAAALATDAITAAKIAADAVAEIADAVWDEPKAGHVTANTYGAYLDASITGVSTGGVSASEIADAVVAAMGTVDANVVTVAAAALTAASLAADAGTEIAAAVWAGAPAGTPLSDIAEAVRDVNNAAPAADSLGAAVNDAAGGGGGGGATAADIWAYGTRTLSASPPTAAAIADAVWDEAQTGHVTAGTFGKYLDASVSGVSTGGASAAAIATAVWTSDDMPAGVPLSDFAGAILTAPANKLATDASGRVTGAANVLDAIPMTLTAAPVTFRDWFVWLTLRFRRTRRNKTSGALTVYGSNGSTVITTQTTTDTETEQTVGVTT